MIKKVLELLGRFISQKNGHVSAGTNGSGPNSKIQLQEFALFQKFS